LKKNSFLFAGKKSFSFLGWLDYNFELTKKN
jgi:hypothetical protein